MTKTGQNRIQSFAFIISITIALGLSCIMVFGFTGSSPDAKAEENRLEGLINPNEAPLVSLIRLPGIGIVKAEAIIEYRGNISKTNNQVKPFQTYEDLQKIKGIGPKTTQNIKQWLKFE